MEGAEGGDPAEGATDALRRQLELIRGVVDRVPGMLAYWDAERRCRFANAAYERWFGVKPEALIGKTMEELLGPIYPRNLPYIEGALRGEEQTFEREIPDPAGGHPRHSKAHYIPNIVDGVVHGFFVMVSDVTELKHVQAEFVAAQRWAAVGTLAAGVAHEINTPVQFVSDNVQFLRNAFVRLSGTLDALRRLPELILSGAAESALREAAAASLEAEKLARLPFLQCEVPSAIEACVDGLARVAAMVRSLDEFARPTGTAMEATDLNLVVERTLAMAVNQYQSVACLETDLGDVPAVVCNAGEISQVLLNLVVNAANAVGARARDTNQRGVIRVTTSCLGGRVTIAVRDTGGGIPPDIQPRIFEPSFTTRGVGKGTGQGLAIAWQIVTQKHGGSLTFETTPGQGATFFVQLPVSGTEGDASTHELRTE